jgi:glycerol-3-phosphate dehydrogenase subunit B
LPDRIGNGYSGAVNRSQDVVVIGGGIAGVAAALASSARGARVTLIRRAPGATALSVGGWLGPMVAPLATHFEDVQHPWPIAPASGLPAPDGSWRSYAHAAAAHAIPLQSPALVCGISGLAGFHAAALVRLWQDLAPVELTATQVTLDATPAAGWSSVSLAAALERSSSEIAAALSARVKETRARSVLLPAVLGIEQSAAVRTAVEAVCGVPVIEALGSTPSLPGWRLRVALDRMLARANISLVTGAVKERANGSHLSSISVATNADQVELEAKAFVLATGKFIGGGIEADGRLREAALNCPIWIEHAGDTFEHAEPLSLTNADRREEQPLLSAGVDVDAEGRPIDRQGNLVYTNVWAAGTVRKGGESPAYGLGHAAAEGWAAGERATA